MDEWLRLCSLDELTEGVVLSVRRDDLDVAVVRSGGTVYAFDNVCSHSAFSFTGLELKAGCQIECAAHGARFDVRDGGVLKGPAAEGLRTYAVQIRGNDVLLRR